MKKKYSMLLFLMCLISQNIFAYKLVTIEKFLFTTANELGSIAYYKKVTDSKGEFLFSNMVKMQMVKNVKNKYQPFYHIINSNAVEISGPQLFKDLEMEYKKISQKAVESKTLGMRKFVKQYVIV